MDYINQGKKMLSIMWGKSVCEKQKKKVSTKMFFPIVIMNNEIMMLKTRFGSDTVKSCRMWWRKTKKDGH